MFKVKKNRRVTRGFLCPAVPLFLAIVILTACKTMPNLVSEPAVSFDSVSFQKIRFDGVDMLARIKVKNGNPFSIPLPELDWKLFVAGEPVLDGTVESGADRRGVNLSANAETGVDIPFTVPFESVYSVLARLVDADEAPYKIQVGARFPIPVLGEKTFTAEFDGLLPLLKAPVLSFNGIQFNSLNPAKVEFVLSWSMENKNAFPVSLDSLDYEFAVNGSPWAKGRTPAALNLAARKTTRVPVTVSISGLSLIGNIVSMAAGGKSAVFSCGGEVVLRPVFEGLEALSVPFAFTGNTNFRN